MFRNLITVLLIVGSIGLAAASCSQKTIISKNAEDLTAKEIIEKNGGAVGYTDAPALERIPKYFAIIHKDNFKTEDYKKNNPRSTIWKSGEFPDRVHFVFQDSPIIRSEIKKYM